MRRWRASVARGQADNRLRSIRRAAARPPGDNVEAALALSAFVTSYARSAAREKEQAPAAIWRRIRERA